MKKKYNKKYKSKKSLKTVNRLRGGFVLPGRFGRVIPPRVVDAATAYLASEAMKAAMNSKAYKSIESKARLAGTVLTAMKEGEIHSLNEFYSIVKSPMPEGEVIGSAESTGSVIKNSVRSISNTGVINSSKLYSTRFASGSPCSRAIKTMKMMNGSKKVTHYDTLVNANAQGTDMRNSLLQATGFNQRKFLAFSADCYTTYNDISQLYGISTADAPSDKYQTVYGALLSKRDEIKIHNSGTVFPVKVKIHLCKMEQTSNSSTSVFNSMVNFTTATQDELAMPKSFQYSNRNESGYISQVNTSLRGPGVFGSSEAKMRVEKVASFSKKLSPGDTWKFTEEFFFKSGVNLTALHGAIANSGISNNNVLTYFPIIEFEGVTAEAVYNSEASSTFIGTSPSWVSLEYSKSYEYVLASRNSTDWTLDGATEGSPAIRVFTNKPREDVEFNINTTQIGTGSTQYSIPVLTDTFVSDAGQRK